MNSQHSGDLLYELVLKFVHRYLNMINIIYYSITVLKHLDVKIPENDYILGPSYEVSRHVTHENSNTNPFEDLYGLDCKT